MVKVVGEISGAAASEAALPRSATTVEDEVARLEQALLDLTECNAASVSLVHCPNQTQERALVRALTAAAHHKKFVTAEVSLAELPLDTPSEIVDAVLDALTGPGERRPGGLLGLLDAYETARGRNALSRFDENVATENAHGDLAALARAYLATDDPEATSEIRAYEAWATGEVPPKKHQNPGVRRVLDERSAQRTFAELTRIVRALEHRGLLIVLTGGDAIAGRTDRQRERAYTVLRELVDNFDGGGGAVATRVMLTGTDAFFHGETSIESLPPLLMRLTIPSDAEPPPPHRSWTSLVREPYEYVHRRIARPPENRAGALRTLIRISEGLPPTEAVTSMSVGNERIDKIIGRLFHHMDMSGSVFTTLVGEYGSGKTHLMMHLAERAVNDGRPVFWLNLERMNLDLGNPPRHLGRLLEHSTLPKRGRPSAREQAGTWTRSSGKLRKLRGALTDVAEGDSEESQAAKKALSLAEAAADPGHALEDFLLGADLADADASPSHRRDAYRRVLLWIALLSRLEGTRGAVILIDEAENLYTTGLPWAARRTALRSLAFYCGGALPGSSVVMAMTPPAFTALEREARVLLGEANEASSTLELEDVALFRRRLSRIEAEPIPALTKNQRLELCDVVRKTHRTVRGAVDLDDWVGFRERLARDHQSPRVLIRALVDVLEATWWAGG